MIDKICQDILEEKSIMVTDSDGSSFIFKPESDNTLKSECGAKDEFGVVFITNNKNAFQYEKKYSIDAILDLQIIIAYDIVYLMRKSTGKVLYTSLFAGRRPFVIIPKEEIVNILKEVG